MTPDDVLATGLRQLEQRSMSNKFDAAVWAEYSQMKADIKQLECELGNAGAAQVMTEGLVLGLVRAAGGIEYVQQRVEHVIHEEA